MEKEMLGNADLTHVGIPLEVAGFFLPLFDNVNELHLTQVP